MERLTNTKEKRKGQEPFEYWLKDSHPLGQIKAIERLAEYEDAEEQGLLLRLPCKVGDAVWQIHTLQKSNRKIITEVVTDAFFIALCVLEGRFGKTVFLTREEAESALAEKGGAK